MAHTVIRLHKCYECATLVEDTPNEYGNTYCKRHKPPVVIDLPVTSSVDLVETAA